MNEYECLGPFKCLMRSRLGRAAGPRYIYMKKRKDFGRYCNFDTVEARGRRAMKLTRTSDLGPEAWLVLRG